MRTLRFLLMMSLILGALSSSMVWAQESKTAIIQVDGLSCPFCTYGLEKQLKKVDGVESVSTDLKAGQATVIMDANVEDRTLRKAVEKAGFSAGDIIHP